MVLNPVLNKGINYRSLNLFSGRISGCHQQYNKSTSFFQIIFRLTRPLKNILSEKKKPLEKHEDGKDGWKMVGILPLLSRPGSPALNGFGDDEYFVGKIKLFKLDFFQGVSDG